MDQREGKNGEIFCGEERIGKLESWRMNTADEGMEMIDAMPLTGNIEGRCEFVSGENKDQFKQFCKDYRKIAKERGGVFPVEMQDGAHTYFIGMAAFTLWSKVKLRLGLRGKIRIKIKRKDREKNET